MEQQLRIFLNLMAFLILAITCIHVIGGLIVRKNTQKSYESDEWDTIAKYFVVSLVWLIAWQIV